MLWYFFINMDITDSGVVFLYFLFKALLACLIVPLVFLGIAIYESNQD
ncbi:MAG: hypothetical protein ACRDBX_04270 [Erysipelotrichaceae bacterium]